MTFLKMPLLNNIFKKLLILIFFCYTFKMTEGLKCYQCFWDDTPEDTTKESLEELAKIKNRKFPVSDHYIGKPGRSREPSGDEIRSECDRTVCQSKDDSCLKWSFISKNPRNITFMCVGNPQRLSGCFQQEIKTKDIKQYLKIEACLCNSDFCNVAAPRSRICPITMYTVLSILLVITKIII